MKTLQDKISTVADNTIERMKSTMLAYANDIADDMMYEKYEDEISWYDNRDRVAEQKELVDSIVAEVYKKLANNDQK